MGSFIHIAEIAGLLLLAYVVGWAIGYGERRLTAHRPQPVELALQSLAAAKPQAPAEAAVAVAPVVVVTAPEPIAAVPVAPPPAPVSALETLKSLSDAMPLVPVAQAPVAVEPTGVVPAVDEVSSSAAMVVEAPEIAAESVAIAETAAPMQPPTETRPEPPAEIVPPPAPTPVPPEPPAPVVVASPPTPATKPGVAWSGSFSGHSAERFGPEVPNRASAATVPARPAKVEAPAQVAAPIAVPVAELPVTVATPAPAAAPPIVPVADEPANIMPPEPMAAPIIEPVVDERPIDTTPPTLDVVLLTSIAEGLNQPLVAPAAPVAAPTPIAPEPDPEPIVTAPEPEALPVSLASAESLAAVEHALLAGFALSDAPVSTPVTEAVAGTPEPSPSAGPAISDEDAAMRAIEGGWSRRASRALPDAPELTDVTAAVSAAQMAVEQVLARNGVDPGHGGERPFGKPRGLPRPRDGARDDLKQINGLGPLDESTLNNMGIYHFDQIAGWDQKEVLWMENHAFARGRIGRETWQAQARALADRPSAARARR